MMQRFLFVAAVAALLTPRAAIAQEDEVDAGQITGNVQLLFQTYQEDSLIGAQIADTIGAQAYDASVVAGTLGGTGSLFRRLDNAVTYIAPAFVPGLTVSAQYTTAADATTTNGASSTNLVNGSSTPVLNSAENLSGSNKGRGFGLSANYVMGPAAAGVSYIRIKGAPASTAIVTTGAQANAGLYVYGAYDLGVAKLTAFYNDDTPSANTAADGHRLYGFQAAVPVITNLTVTGGYAYAHNVTTAGVYDAKGTKHDNAGIITLKAQYDLSKRTAVYALFTEIQNGDKAALGLSGVSTIADKSARGLAVGIRHAF